MSDFGLPMTYLEWSVPPGSDLMDPAVLRAANPAMAVGRLTEEYAYGVERALLTEDEFARERFGIFNEDAGFALWELIDEGDWNGCSSPLTPGWVGAPLTYAVEVTTDRQWASIGVAGSHPRGHAIEVGEHRPLIDGGKEWLVDRVVALWAKKPKAILIDPRSPAGPYIRELVDVHKVTITEVTSADYAKGCGLMLDGIKARTITHHDQPDLSASAAAVVSKPLGDALIFDRRLRDITPLSACSIALWGALEMPDPTPAPFDFIT